MAEEKIVKYDLDGYSAVTDALRELINQYPGLDDGQEISFSVLDEDGGVAMFPVSGAIVETERKYITGGVSQICLYPFYVVYRAAGLSENRKASVLEWLDNLGKWLERQSVTINNTAYQLDEYPSLNGNRKFLSISRQTPAYLDSVNEDKSENWAISLSARYKNEYGL